MPNEKAEFAVKTLKRYAAENHTLPRGTSDISPLEEWLILELMKKPVETTNEQPKICARCLRLPHPMTCTEDCYDNVGPK